MTPLLAALPVLVVLFFMVAVGWSAARAGVLTAVLTLVLAVWSFGFGGAADPFGPLAGSLGVLAEAAFISLTIVAIIGPALGIHHLQKATGATDRLRGALARLHPDPRVAALVIAWFFSLFLEGAAGFGTPVALAAPFLVAAGFSPVAALVAALVGHAVGVSFGAVGTPVLAQTAIVDATGLELSRATSWYHLLLGLVLVLVLVRVIGGSSAAERAPWGWGLFAGVAFLVPYGLIAQLVGPELPTLGGALVGVAVFAAVAVRVRPRSVGAVASAIERPGAVAIAAAPYLVLVALVLATRLVVPVRDLVEPVVVEWQVGDTFSGSVRPLFHPGLLLTVSFGLGAIVQRASRREVVAAVRVATGQLAGVVVALLAMVTVARAMSQSGMTDELAETAAGSGGLWPLFAPAVGALGTFVTGSATASNVLFTELQDSTARAADVPVLPVLGAQGFGAAIGNVICPHNIVAAGATVGLKGQEGLVLRRTLPAAAVYVVLGGLLALLFSR